MKPDTETEDARFRFQTAGAPLLVEPSNDDTRSHVLLAGFDLQAWSRRSKVNGLPDYLVIDRSGLHLINADQVSIDLPPGQYGIFPQREFDPAVSGVTLVLD